MFDMHVHSNFSHDGKSSLGEYGAVVNDRGLQAIGFAEHVDYFPGASGYGVFDYKAYIDEVEKFKQMGYGFYAGAEVGFLLKEKDLILGELRKHKFDFAICSVHRSLGYSLSTNKSVEYFKDTALFRSIVGNYYSDVTASLEIEDFDAIGHIGIFRRYLEDSLISGNGMKREIAEMEDELARQCALSGKIIEANTSGLLSPYASTYPGTGFFKAYFGYGGRRVSIGSDAHSAAKLGMGFEQTKEMLKSIGFRYLYLPWKDGEGISL